jgi:hypothetical protein
LPELVLSRSCYDFQRVRSSGNWSCIILEVGYNMSFMMVMYVFAHCGLLPCHTILTCGQVPNIILITDLRKHEQREHMVIP